MGKGFALKNYPLTIADQKSCRIDRFEKLSPQQRHNIKIDAQRKVVRRLNQEEVPKTILFTDTETAGYWKKSSNQGSDSKRSSVKIPEPGLRSGSLPTRLTLV
ncbi:MAG: hypothetical protein GY757_44350 [bacterium]|nr:hypothetical protein [bacterium]